MHSCYLLEQEGAEYSPDTPKKLKKAIDRMLPKTAMLNSGMLKMALKAATASSRGSPLVPLTKDITGRMKEHSTRPQQPSRPTAKSAGTCSKISSKTQTDQKQHHCGAPDSL